MATQYDKMAVDVNQLMTGEANKPYLANLPNYANMVGQRSINTGQMLKGQLPDDVINQLAQQAAERGVAGGAPASDANNAAYLRSLGLNSLQMMQQGSANLSQSISDTPVPELFNPMSLEVPRQMAAWQLEAAKAGMQAGGGGGGSRGGGIAGVVGGLGLAPKAPIPRWDPGPTQVYGGSDGGGLGTFDNSWFASSAPQFTASSPSSQWDNYDFNKVQFELPTTPDPSYNPLLDSLGGRFSYGDTYTPSSSSNWLSGWSTALGGGLGSSLYANNPYGDPYSSPASSGQFEDFGQGGGSSFDFGGDSFFE